ncbi:MAG: DUF1697 domain-containing protein [Ruminococcus sp.]|nr:DUF1697 domain-containing protein [Ruminococcus sp.]
MQVTAFLRGVMPSGKNSIPKMSYLSEVLRDCGFENVQTYIQSGNILLDTDLSFSETAQKIHNIILEKIGADLAVIIKTKAQLRIAVQENPFDNKYDYSRIHLVFTNDFTDKDKITAVEKTQFFGEILRKGSECLYMYLPRDAEKKKLNNNFLEKRLKITSTMRKLNVIEHLYGMLD